MFSSTELIETSFNRKEFFKENFNEMIARKIKLSVYKKKKLKFLVN